MNFKKLKELTIQYPNNEEFAKVIREMVSDGEETVLTTDSPYIYERNPDTGEIFRRKSGDYDSPRECINPEINSVPNIKI
tara:strand:- start:921 stop:1160 length:240 start_codon:yes stop_codon:yes gene_type:complete